MNNTIAKAFPFSIAEMLATAADVPVKIYVS